uniref:Uncharacterized protein n=1 Tax=Oryza glumipatula TaxID=40148 RepID=A0A0E0A9U4_9ORYZ
MCAWQQRSADGWAANGGAQGQAVDGGGGGRRREARVEVGVGARSGDGDGESGLGATVGVEATAATMERDGEGAEGTSAAPPSDACTMQHNCASSSASPLPSSSASAAAALGGAGQEWRGGPNLAVVAAAGVADARIDRNLVHRLQRGGVRRRRAVVACAGVALAALRQWRRRQSRAHGLVSAGAHPLIVLHLLLPVGDLL